MKCSHRSIATAPSSTSRPADRDDKGGEAKRFYISEVSVAIKTPPLVGDVVDALLAEPTGGADGFDEYSVERDNGKQNYSHGREDEQNRKHWRISGSERDVPFEGDDVRDNYFEALGRMGWECCPHAVLHSTLTAMCSSTSAVVYSLF